MIEGIVEVRTVILSGTERFVCNVAEEAGLRDDAFEKG
jgi:hypothetical protein